MSGLLARIAEGVEAPRVPERHSLLASATQVSMRNQSWSAWRFRDEGWQRELWRLYDVIPELRFAANWVGSAVSRCEIYVANVDELGRVQGRCEEEDVAALSDTVLGGPAAKAEALRSLGINMTVAGEAYIVGQPKAAKDKWYILSSTEVRRRDGLLLWGDKKFPMFATEGVDLVTRVWTQHPSRIWCADSPARSCQPILLELERLTKFIFSQIDSRLIGAGVLLIPNSLDFPSDDSQSTASETLMQRLAQAGAESLKGEGTAAAQVPLIIESNPEDVEGWRHITFATELSRQAVELRTEAIRRFGVGMDMPLEALTGAGDANHWCVDDTTTILTPQGWVDQRDLRVGDLVYTLDHEAGLAQWQPVRDIYRANVVDEPMYLMDRKGHSSLTTSAHRWPVLRRRHHGKVPSWDREFATSAELDQYHRVITAAPCADLPVEAKYTDDFVELVAWMWTEGSFRGTGGATIAQSHTANPGRVDRIRGVLTRLLGPATPADRGPRTARWRESVQANESSHGGPVTVFHLSKAASDPLRDVAPGKIVTLDFARALTRAQLELFIEVSCLGDGWHLRSGRRDIWQRDPAALDAYELALILSGRMVNSNEYDGGRVVSPWSRTSTLPMKSVAGAHGPHLVPYTGTVWCPVTDNSTWLARRDGTVYFTGNSNWFINESGTKIHIEPLMTRICDALADVYLTPALKIMGKDPARYTYQFSTAPLTVRPERLTEAINLYNLNLLSAEAVREEGNFSESQAPEPQESITRFVKELMLRDPTLFQATGVRDLIGITEEILPPELATPPPPPPAPLPQGGATGIPPAIPERTTETDPSLQAGLEAGLHHDQLALVVLLDAMVRRALERAGGKLLQRGVQRKQFAGIASHELHTRIRVLGPDHAATLLEGAFAHLPDLVTYLAGDDDSSATRFAIDPHGETSRLETFLHDYCAQRLLSATAHDAPTLAAAMGSYGLI